jgi:hypothetical protein
MDRVTNDYCAKTAGPSTSLRFGGEGSLRLEWLADWEKQQILLPSFFPDGSPGPIDQQRQQG